MNLLFIIIANVVLTVVPVITPETLAAQATNIPRVSVDTEPLKPGIQSKLKHLGPSVTVDIVITGLAELVDVYEFILKFNPKILRIAEPEDVVSGGLLPGGGIIQKDLTNPSEVYSAVGFMGGGGGAAGGEDILATITFEVIGSGTSKLDLTYVVLAGQGEEVRVNSSDGVVTVPRPPHT